MSSQVIGIVEMTLFGSRSAWNELAEAPGHWRESTTDEVDADLERLETELTEEWSQWRMRLGKL